MPPLETERLILRRWRPEDREPFAAINGDPEVGYWLGGVITRERSDGSIARAEASFEEKGFGRWAVERRSDGALIGWTGIMTVWPEYPFSGVEIGWRLTRSAWGQGYASEAARAALKDGFERVGFSEILAYTTLSNHRSMRVMERISMTRDPARDFDHPLLARDHPMSRHMLFVAKRSPR
ncbi:MAG: GNAT family N-acetyltransferase [Alphaproteobacteria bacterium]